MIAIEASILDALESGGKLVPLLDNAYQGYASGDLASWLCCAFIAL